MIDSMEDKGIYKVHFSEQGQEDLAKCICPYCDSDFDESTLFTGEDGRDGGEGFCSFCRIQFSWIENPFECEVKEDSFGPL